MVEVLRTKMMVLMDSNGRVKFLSGSGILMYSWVKCVFEFSLHLQMQADNNQFRCRDNRIIV